MATEKNTIKFDGRLKIPFDFVCKFLNVSKDDFASLAISNLLEEELDWIHTNHYDVDSEEIKKYIKIVKIVKFEADGWVLRK